MRIKRVFLAVCVAVLVLSLAVAATTPWLTYTVNLTHSLPGTLYIVQKGSAFQNGDLVAYHWPGGATYPAGTLFIKQVMGVPGDQVRRQGQTFWVNEQLIGEAKPVSRAGVPLSPAHAGIIRPAEYFVAAPHPDSLDSRYALSQNIRQTDIVGKAYAVF